MNNCKSKEWVKRKISQKKKRKEQYQNCMGKNVQENSNEGMETTMLKEMENSENYDEEILDY